METQRFHKRILVAGPIAFEVEGRDRSRWAGDLADVSSSGARLIANNSLFVGQRLKIYSSLLAWFQVNGEIIWAKPAREGQNEYGLRFSSPDASFSEALLLFMKKRLPVPKSKSVMFWSMVGLGVGFPLLHIIGLTLSNTPGKWIFFGYITCVAIERIWETFLTSREKKVFQPVDDWTIAAVTFYYVTMILGIVGEFYFFPRVFYPLVSEVGVAILLSSFVFRFWGMRSLGNQWAIHAVGEIRRENPELALIRQGPYKLVRHPIYLGVVLELIALPLIPGCFFTLAFALLVNVPLQIFRSRLEEESCAIKFSADFLKYHNEVGGFVPKISRRRPSSVDRRREEHLIDFCDRRGGKER